MYKFVIISRRIHSSSVNDKHFTIMPDEETHRKQLAAASYALLMLTVGLPVWWKTTQVYRSFVPHSEISSLAGLSTVQEVPVMVVCRDQDDIQLRARALQTLLANSNVYSVSLTTRLARPGELQVVDQAGDLAEVDRVLGPQLVKDTPGGLVLVELPAILFPEVPHLLLGNHRTLYFSPYVSSEDLAGLVMDAVLGEARLAAMQRSYSDLSDRAAPADTNSKRTIGQMDLFLSLLIPQPEFVQASWQVEVATKRFLKPFLDTFPINFTVRSQVLYLTPLDIPAAAVGSGPLEVNFCTV